MDYYWLFATHITWSPTQDKLLPYEATLDQLILVIQVNDFPAEALFSLIINGCTIIDFNDWPATWTRPLGEMHNEL